MIERDSRGESVPRILLGQLRELTGVVARLTPLLERMASELESRAKSRHPAAVRPLRPVPAFPQDLAQDRVVCELKMTTEANGRLRVKMDARPAALLPYGSAQLLALLAEPTGHTVDDGLAGFKTSDVLREQLARHLNRPITRRALIQRVHRLRVSMNGALPGSGQLIEQRNQFGYRLRLQLRRTE